MATGKRLCRLCLTDQGVLHRIFGGGAQDLADKIFDCTAIEVVDSYGVPAFICDLCRSKIVVCHQFVVGCQKSDRKIHKMFGPQFREHRGFQRSSRLSTASSSSGIGELTGDAETPKVPSKTVAIRGIPASHAVVRRLQNDDKMRRHSIDDTRKVPARKDPKRRLSDEPTIEQLAAKIERSLNSEVESTSSSDSGREKCPTCGKMVAHLDKHMVLHSTIERPTCDLCGRSFARKLYLTYHMNIHNGIKPFKCTQCDRCFYRPNALWEHKQKTHDHVRNFFCEICAKAYNTRNYLKKHKKIVHGLG